MLISVLKISDLKRMCLIEEGIKSILKYLNLWLCLYFYLVDRAPYNQSYTVILGLTFPGVFPPIEQVLALFYL